MAGLSSIPCVAHCCSLQDRASASLAYWEPEPHSPSAPAAGTWADEQRSWDSEMGVPSTTPQ